MSHAPNIRDMRKVPDHRLNIYCNGFRYQNYTSIKHIILFLWLARSFNLFNINHYLVNIIGKAYNQNNSDAYKRFFRHPWLTNVSSGLSWTGCRFQQGLRTHYCFTFISPAKPRQELAAIRILYTHPPKPAFS